jgi:hypothetical protein
MEIKQIWTYTLNAGTLVIDGSYGLSEISLLMTVGNGSVTGSAVLPNSVPSTPIVLILNTPLTIGTGSSAALLNITVTTTGTILIVGR